MELWLVRHGVTRANLEGRLQGTLSFPLGPEGRREARCLAARLKEQTFSACFCSSELRARQTACILKKMAHIPAPLYTPLLREYCWGIVQGLTRREIGARYPALLEQLEKNFHQAVIPGAEGIDRLLRRAAYFYRLLAALERTGKYSQPVLVISHGRFLHAFILLFLKHDGRRGWPFPVSPASLTVLEGNFQGKHRLKLFNDTCHLKTRFCSDTDAMPRKDQLLSPHPGRTARLETP